jgi:hypothetical protein
MCGYRIVVCVKIPDNYPAMTVVTLLADMKLKYVVADRPPCDGSGSNYRGEIEPEMLVGKWPL